MNNLPYYPDNAITVEDKMVLITMNRPHTNSALVSRHLSLSKLDALPMLKDRAIMAIIATLAGVGEPPKKRRKALQNGVSRCVEALMRRGYDGYTINKRYR